MTHDFAINVTINANSSSIDSLGYDSSTQTLYWDQSEGRQDIAMLGAESSEFNLNADVTLI